MELRLLSNQQLMEIYDVVIREVKRRKKDNVESRREALKWHLRKLEDAHADFIFKHYEETLHHETRCFALRCNDRHSPPGARIRYLPPLLRQDWSHLFAETDQTAKYYVYAHVDPAEPQFGFKEDLGGSCAMPFYIGKGCGDRALNLNRNEGHGKRLAVLKARGVQPNEIVRILRAALTERQAFELEAKLIYFFGTVWEADRRGVLLNLNECPRPRFIGEMTKRGGKNKNKVNAPIGVEFSHSPEAEPSEDQCSGYLPSNPLQPVIDPPSPCG